MTNIMSKQREAMQMALEALEEAKRIVGINLKLLTEDYLNDKDDLTCRAINEIQKMIGKSDNSIIALREALAQEPVAWVTWDEGNVPELTWDVPTPNDVANALYY